MGKVTIFTSEFPPGPGGIGSHAYNLACQLTLNSFKVIVIAPNSYESDQKKFDVSKTFKIHRYSSYRIFKLFTIIYYFFKYSLKRHNRVFLTTGQFPLLLIGNILGLFNRKSISIIHGHETLMGSKIKKKLINKALKNFDNLVAVSSFSKSVTLKNCPHLKKLIVINNGFEINRFHGYRRDNNRQIKGIRLITVGSMTKRKGQHNVIGSLPYLKGYFKDIKYHIIGKPIIQNELINLAKALEVEENIKFHGYASDEDMIEIMTDSNLFIMLSEYTYSGEVEGFGIAILEANYMGLPAIGSKDCGIEDAIKDGNNGRLISLDNHKEMKDAIDDIISDYERYSVNAKSWAKKHSWEVIIKKYLTIISDLCQE